MKLRIGNRVFHRPALLRIAGALGVLGLYGGVYVAAGRYGDHPNLLALGLVLALGVFPLLRNIHQHIEKID